MPSDRTRRLARQYEQLGHAASELQYQSFIEVRADALGWRRSFHVLRSQVKGRWVTNTSSPGVPDLWLLRPGHLLVFEVKALGGTATDDQLAWVAWLQTVPGVEAYVVDPTDVDDVLDLLARPGPANG